MWTDLSIEFIVIWLLLYFFSFIFVRIFFLLLCFDCYFDNNECVWVFSHVSFEIPFSNHTKIQHSFLPHNQFWALNMILISFRNLNWMAMLAKWRDMLIYLTYKMWICYGKIEIYSYENCKVYFAFCNKPDAQRKPNLTKISNLLKIENFHQ